jgi:hypothetical protein
MIKGLIKVLMLVLISGVAGADELTLPAATNAAEAQGREGAIQQLDMLSQSADLEKFRGQLGSALDAIIGTAVQNLRKEGFHEDARQIQSEWSQTYSLYFFSSYMVMDLGDHAPLVPWLAKVMNKIEKKIGRPIMQRTRIYDLKVINYGIPVTFTPGGERKTGLAWGQTEYGKHFIPLAGVVTYWTSRIACKQLAANQPIVSMFCKTIAGIAEKIVVKRVAPRMSSSIYMQANMKRKK